MADSVQAAPPVNATITIQPVATAVANRDPNAANNPLANLPTGTLVQGFVINRDAQNNPVLRTPLGDLQIASEVFLKTGSEVVFRVDATQNSLARILTVDGMSPEAYSAQGSAGLTEDTISATALQVPLTNVAALPGEAAPAAAPVLQAIVLQAQPLPMAALDPTQSEPMSAMLQLSQLSAGTPVKLTLLDLKLPPSPVAPNAVPAANKLDALLPPLPTGQPTPAMPANMAAPMPMAEHETTPVLVPPSVAPQEDFPAALLTPTVQTPASVQAMPQLVANEIPTAAVPLPTAQAAPTANAMTTPAVQEILPPAQAVPAAISNPQTNAAQMPATAPSQANAPLAQPSAPNQFVASVIGHDADGANILHTPAASLKVYTPQPLPTGTTMLVATDSAAPAPAASPNAAANAVPSFIPSPAVAATPLATLEQAISWLAANYPDSAAEIQQRMPVVSDRLASSMLSYIGAIKTGDIGELIGKRAVRLLDLGAPEILAKLRQQVGEMQTQLTSAPASNWQQVMLPIWSGGELEMAKLFISKDAPESEASPATSPRGQRFVLEVGLSHLGDVQFDGFVRERQPAKSFDLMVRSHTALPNEVSQGIREIFDNSMQVTGMQGQVVFQHGRQYFVQADTGPSRRPSGDGAHTILA